jgi:hypothetical protein
MSNGDLDGAAGIQAVGSLQWNEWLKLSCSAGQNFLTALASGATSGR